MEQAIIAFRICIYADEEGYPEVVLPLAGLTCIYLATRREGACLMPRADFVRRAFEVSPRLRTLASEIIEWIPANWQVELELHISHHIQ